MKPTLIIADDVDVIRRELHRGLHGEFDIVAEATDGQEAFDLARQHKPQLIVMDVVMPRMSGIEATRLLLLDRSPSQPKIVILSGLRDESVVMQAIEAGASDYLFKPVDMEKLRKVLWGFLRSVA